MSTTESLAAAARTTHLDGTSTEYFDCPATEETLIALIRALFEEHWSQIDFGPCIQGAVFELRYVTQPRIGYLDGYFTIGEEGSWHFHLCVGAHKGTKAHPTPPELAEWRRCSRVSFFRDSDPNGRPSTWGIRLWNGRGEQMMTVFCPNPWLNAERTKRVREPDWSRLALWMNLRAQFAGVSADPLPAADTPRPAIH